MEIKGIDVSSWQGKIDWNKVANYGMDFAILRITEAGNVIDGQFENNFAGCNKYKIPVTFNHFIDGMLFGNMLKNHSVHGCYGSCPVAAMPAMEE